MTFGGMRKPASNMVLSMRLFKKLIKNYLFFGLGVIFGSVISTFVTYAVFSISYGTPTAAKVLQIQECLEDKINE